MNKNKIIWTVVIIVVIVGALIYANTGERKNLSDTYTIGAVETLTGNVAYIGVSTKQGLEIAKEEIALKYPDLKLNIVHEDSLFTPQGGINAYNKLKTSDHIDALVTQASNVSIALLPLAKQDNIIHFGVSTLANGFTSPNDLSYRLTPKADIEAVPVIAYMQAHKLTKLAILNMNNEIGTSLVDSLKKEAAAKGIAIVLHETYPADATDFKTQLIKVKQLNPEVVYLASLAPHTAQILKQSDELRFKPTFISYRATEDPVLVKNAGVLAEGMLYTSAFDIENNDEAHQSFVQKYEEKYAEKPNGYAAEAYEATRLIAETFVKCGKDTTCAATYLNSVKNRPSVFGNLSFDENGDVIYPFFLKTVKDGKFVRFTE